ncbi:nitrous oxide-stimulated promoter family protein [Sulfurospirillum arcachonense]|uniref:nitrous oxide-stimulated promoter family protein n=1 Tax=Sulfurospirillum arcachonense TaxID=57666 RepID=UPI000469F8E7|nr:nitrous oxide-stimulated promoter family protein [Sulfurospirillum arcachonense]
MTKEKFIIDSSTVLKFIQIYCDDKHKDATKLYETLQLNYLNENLDEKLEYHLCSTCKETFVYSYQRLKECPHDEKPRCRKCPNPCYEKTQWKKLATIMRYGGIQLGLNKIKKIFIK